MKVATKLLTVIPKPVKVEYFGADTTEFNLSSTTVLYANGEESKLIAKYLSQKLESSLGLTINDVISSKPSSNFIEFNLDDSTFKKEDGTLQYKEGYMMQINSNFIQIKASQPAGLFYGVQTLLQLCPNSVLNSSNAPNNNSNNPNNTTTIKLSSIQILDYPRFAWRGIHLDVCRHFFPLEFLYKYLSTLALHKFNTFHFHLTEDQGWRFESLKYPNLTTIGSTRSSTLIAKGPEYDNVTVSGFYTQSELKQLVAYARVFIY